MFFSLTSILIISVVLIIVIIQTSKERGQARIEAVQFHIRALNSFMADLEESYYQEMLQVAAERSFEALSLYTQKKAAAIEQPHAGSAEKLKANFKTVLFFGYIQDSSGFPGEETICREYGRWILTRTGECPDPYRVQRYKKIDSIIGQNLMTGFAFFDILNATERTSSTLGLRILNFDVQLQGIYQTEPFAVDGDFFISYDFTEKTGLASWKGSRLLHFTIPIFDIPDPLAPGQLIGRSWVVDRGSTKDRGSYQVGGACSFTPVPGAALCHFTEPSFLSRLLNSQSYSGNVFDTNEYNLERTNGICPASKGCHLS